MDRIAAAQRRMMQQKFRHLGRTALYFADPAAANPQRVLVCITDMSTSVGDLKGAGSGYAEVEIDAPSIEFLREQVEPSRAFYVSVAPGIAYQVDTVLPHDELVTTVRATRLRGDKLRNFPVP